MSIESVMPSNHLILCHSLLLPLTFPSIRVYSRELALRIRWPKYWSFSFSISPSSEYSGISFMIGLISQGFTCGSAGKESAYNAGNLGLIPGLGRSPGEERGFPLQYSGLENSMDCKRFDLLRVSSNTMDQKHRFYSAQPSLWSTSRIHM